MKTVYYTHNEFKHGAYYDAFQAEDEYLVAYPFTATPIPESLVEKTAKYDWTESLWKDWSIQATMAEKEAALAAQKQATTALETEKATTNRLSAELKSEKKKSDEYQVKLKQAEIAMQAMNVLTAFAGAHTDLMSDVEAKALAVFIPGWDANGQKLSKGQVVLGDDQKLYRVLKDVTTSVGEHPEVNREDYELIN